MSDARVRHAIYHAFAEGGIPLSAAISHQLHMPVEDVQSAMERLHAHHAIVLDSRTRETLMALPFSSVPTPFTVAGGGRSWFANCAWDAFGIPAALDCDAHIDAVCAWSGDPVPCGVEHGLAYGDGLIHLLVAAAHFWDDIAYT